MKTGAVCLTEIISLCTLDCITMTEYILGKDTGALKRAATDINEDNDITVLDLIMLKSWLLK